MRGRKPTPADLIDPAEHKKAKEEIEERRKIENSLKVSSKLTCPKILSSAAKKEWRRVMRLYNMMGSDILCDLDITALSMYCEAVAIYQKSQETWVKINQVVASNEKVQKLIDRCIKVMNDQSKVINNLAEQLCLTPVGRARMGLMKSNIDEPDELSELGF